MTITDEEIEESIKQGCDNDIKFKYYLKIIMSLRDIVLNDKYPSYFKILSNSTVYYYNILYYYPNLELRLEQLSCILFIFEHNPTLKDDLEKNYYEWKDLYSRLYKNNQGKLTLYYDTKRDLTDNKIIDMLKSYRNGQDLVDSILYIKDELIESIHDTFFEMLADVTNSYSKIKEYHSNDLKSIHSEVRIVLEVFAKIPIFKNTLLSEYSKWENYYRSLNTGLKKQSREKIHKCDFNTCEKMFYELRHLVQHKKIHAIGYNGIKKSKEELIVCLLSRNNINFQREYIIYFNNNDDTDKKYIYVDFVIFKDGITIILEVDENQHKGQYYSNDIERMFFIYKHAKIDRNKPIYIIRFNPGDFKINRIKQSIGIEERHNKLLDVIASIDKNIRSFNILYMFYDCSRYQCKDTIGLNSKYMYCKYFMENFCLNNHHMSIDFSRD